MLSCCWRLVQVWLLHFNGKWCSISWLCASNIGDMWQLRPPAALYANLVGL